MTELSPTGFYKVLNGKNGPQHGGNGKWRIGKRRSVRGELVPCGNGLHAVTLEQLPRWLGPSIHPVLECSEERVDAGDKWVFRWLVVGEAYETWNERSARHFAADCAARALREVKRLHGWEDKRCIAAMTGKEIKAQVMEALGPYAEHAACPEPEGEVWDCGYRPIGLAHAALAPCVVLTREEAANVRTWIAAGTEPERPARERIIALLTPEEP